MNTFFRTVVSLRRQFLEGTFVLLLILAILSKAIAQNDGIKTGPHGIIGLLPSFNSARPVDLARPIWSNPLLAGVRLRTVWRNVEPEENRFDWSYLDDAAALAARSGK